MNDICPGLEGFEGFEGFEGAKEGFIGATEGFEGAREGLIVVFLGGPQGAEGGAGDARCNFPLNK